MGNEAFTNPTKLGLEKLEQDSRDFGSVGTDSSASKGKSRLVDCSPLAITGQTLAVSNTGSFDHRCKPIRLGGPCSEFQNTGSLATSYEKSVFKLQGIDGSEVGSDSISTLNSIQACSDKDGQFHSCGVYKSPGGNEVTQAIDPGIRNTGHSGTDAVVNYSNSLEGVHEYTSRSTKSKTAVECRMAIEPRSISVDNICVGDACHRSVCQQGKYKVSSVFFPERQRQSNGSGCFVTDVGFQSSICIPSSESVTVGIEKDCNIQNKGDSYCSKLATKVVVSSASEIKSGGADTTSFSRQFNSDSETGCSRHQQMEVNSLVTEERILKTYGLSDKVVDTLIKSRKKNTRAIYLKYWKTYNLWKEQSGFRSNEVATVLEFLQNGVDKKLALSTIKVQISALSVFLDRQLAGHPLIARFVKSIERNRPIAVKPFPKWDLSLVLKALTKPPFDCASNMNLRLLTFKTIFLVAITSARRVSELEALSCREPYCIFYNDRVVLRTSSEFIPKVGDIFYRSQEIILPSFYPNPTNDNEKQRHLLDVRQILKDYLQRVESLRKTEALFVNFTGKLVGQRASKRTIANWIKLCIMEAYKVMETAPPKDLKAHSTRGTATTWAFRAGASPLEICKAATWKNLGTFMRHYRLDRISSSDQDFGRKVLEAVSPP
ncbi:uncharacterized protein [Hyperolius riggenbachi]